MQLPTANFFVSVGLSIKSGLFFAACDLLNRLKNILLIERGKLIAAVQGSQEFEIPQGGRAVQQEELPN